MAVFSVALLFFSGRDTPAITSFAWRTRAVVRNHVQTTKLVSAGRDGDFERRNGDAFCRVFTKS
jgi:hypothetical protein